MPADGKMRSYCYIEVDHIQQLDISYIKDILSHSDKKNIAENRGQNSVFYVNLTDSFEYFLNTKYLNFNEVIESKNKESIMVEE